MYFERRELKDYAEPVDAGTLRLNEVYFSVQFVDDDLLIPILEPIVFVESHKDSTGRQRFVFQDFESFSEGVRFDPSKSDERNRFQVADGSGMKHIFEFEHALDVLLICALKRKGTSRTS